MAMQATITSKGQITVPKAIREQLHLRPGDKLDFLLEEGGGLRVEPVTEPVTALKGMLPKPRHAVTLAEMDQAVTAGAAGAPPRLAPLSVTSAGLTEYILLCI